MYNTYKTTENINNWNNTQPPPNYNIDTIPTAPLEPLPIISKSQKIHNLISKYEIDNLFSEKLDVLSNYEIVLLIDDSGSMNTPLVDSIHNTRWDELKEVVKIVIEVATIFDDDGIDINFLNRQNYENVRDINYVNSILEEKPYGLTPLNSSLIQIFDKYQNSVKPVLVVIATDGIPTNIAGYEDIGTFKKTLKNKNHSNFFISFLACSDNDNDVGYLNKLDKEIPNIDTLDDYHSELKEVKKAQGKKFNYTFGDHVMRLLLGPLYPELDKLDEKKCMCNIL